MVVQCPSCSKKMSVDDKYAGRQVKCPGCGAVLQVPQSGDEAPPVVEVVDDGGGASPPVGLAGPTGPIGARSEPIMVLILTFVTCGIYGIFWMFKTVAEINSYLGREVVSTLLLILGICCAPVNIYNIYLMAKAMPEMQGRVGLPAKDDTLLLVLLMIVFPLVVPMIVQGELNKIWDAG